MNERNRRIITILSIFTIIFTVMGGTLAYWNWSSTTRTGVSFTLDKDFSCSADGGQNINSTNIALVPTSDCTNSDYALQKELKLSTNTKGKNLDLYLDMWLKINSIGTGLSNSENLKYAITTDSGSCTNGVVSSGNFKGLTAGGKVNLLDRTLFTGTKTNTYYLYIWLDAAETSVNTMNQSFNLSLEGKCTDAPYVEPEAPLLDDAMIPVTIADDGTVITIDKNNRNWYDYSKKQWANVVMVNENATEGVANSHSRSYYQNNMGEEVTKEDILAYYVWIPRYKYKIPTNKSCGDIEGVNYNDYPYCYDVGYALLVDEGVAVEKIKVGLEGTEASYSFCAKENDDGTPNFTCTDDDARNLLYKLLAGEKPTYDTPVGLVEIGMNYYLTNGVDYSTEYSLKSDFFASAGNITTIDIQFEDGTDTMENGNATSTYRTHPAFSRSGKTLSGFWFAKFEPSYITSTYCVYSEDYDGDGIIDYCEESTEYLYGFIPNVTSDSFADIDPTSGMSFTNKFGLNTEDFLILDISNSQWGAIAYLSHSIYGINKEIRINNTYVTGCGAITDNAVYASNCDSGIKFGNGVSSYPQSTTGNISGIFDMSGGKDEAVGTGFSYAVDNQYSDNARIMGLSCDGSFCHGHAIFDINNWYNDLHDLYIYNDETNMDQGIVNLYRGGTANSGTGAGIFAYRFENYVEYGPLERLSRKSVVSK